MFQYYISNVQTISIGPRYTWGPIYGSGPISVIEGSPREKNGKKNGQYLPQFIHFNPNLPGPQFTWKWTMHTDKLTTKYHNCLHTCKYGGFNVQDLGLAIHDSEGSQ